MNPENIVNQTYQTNKIPSKLTVTTETTEIVKIYYFDSFTFWKSENESLPDVFIFSHKQISHVGFPTGNYILKVNNGNTRPRC